MPKQTILVIEDEEKLRRVIGLHLAAAGHDVNRRPGGVYGEQSGINLRSDKPNIWK